MPIKGITENMRMPRVGKIHLGIKVEKIDPKTKEPMLNKKTGEVIIYPTATDYFVYPDKDSPGGELLPQLIKAYGEKPKQLRIIFALEQEEYVASQYYRCYTRSRGLICRGDGETCMRMLDKKTGYLPTKDTKDTENKEMTCEGRECPEYQSGQCREVMNLQFILPEISGLGVWQIDTSSINSIRNINSCLQMVRSVYNRIAMVPLLLTLEKMEVTPPGGTKKNVNVLHIRSTDNMIEMAMKAMKPPMELIAGPVDHEKVERDIEELWPQEEQERKLSDEEAANRMTPREIEEAKSEDEGLTEEEKAEAPEKPSGLGIDMDWLEVAMATIKWSEKTATSFIKSKPEFKGIDTSGSLEEVLSKMSKEQQRKFVEMVQELESLS